MPREICPPGARVGAHRGVDGVGSRLGPGALRKRSFTPAQGSRAEAVLPEPQDQVRQAVDACFPVCLN